MLAARSFVVLVALLSLVPPTLAEGGPGIVHVIVKDRLGDGCYPRVEGVCAADASTDGSAGNTSVDAYHEFRYVGAGFDVSSAEAALGQDVPVPEERVGIDFGSFLVPYPVFLLADDAEERVPWTDERHRLSITEEDVALHYHAPSFTDPSGEPGNQSLVLLMFNESRGVGYGGFRLVNAPGPWVSDREFDNLHLCEQAEYRGAFGGADCWKNANATAAGLKTATPSAVVGAHFYTAEIATNASHLQPPDDRAQSAESVGVLRRPSPASRDALGSRPDPKGASSWVPPPGAGDPLPDGLVADDPSPPTPPLSSLATTQQRPPHNVVWLRAAAAVAFGFLLVLAALGLYSRFQTRHALLASPARRRLEQVVLTQPGVSLTNAAKAIGLSPNTALHHARLLAKAGIIRMISPRHRVFLYPSGVARPEPSASVFLRKPVDQDAIVRALDGSPRGLTRAELRELMPQVPETTRNYRLRRLLRLSVIEEVHGDGGEIRIRLVAAISTAQDHSAGWHASQGSS